ncbi:hypothetical protein LTR22_026888, partial [Elasticomyces elasticus]
IYAVTTKPWYAPGFSTSCATLAFTIVGFSSLPFWLLLEARQRKKKTGHAMPLQALEDALHAQVSEAVLLKEQEAAAMEVKQRLDQEAAYVEHVQLEERK